MKSISFNCTKIERSRTRVLAAHAAQGRGSALAHRDSCSQASPCSLPVLLLWTPAYPLGGSQVPHPPLHLLPVCVTEIDAPAWILFFFLFLFLFPFAPLPPPLFPLSFLLSQLLAPLCSHPTLCWLAPARKPGLLSRLNEHNK